MEDFGSIIGLVAIVLAMVLGIARRRREGASEAGKSPSGSGEAWPSWDTTNGKESTGNAADKTTESPTPWPVTSAAPAQQRRTVTPIPETPARQATRTDPKPVLQPTVRSIPEIPNTDNTASATPDRKQTEHPITEGELMSRKRQLLASIAARHGNIADAAQPPGPAADKEPPAPDLAAEIREEFDLRRAVLYSEIMKPKYEEGGY